MAELLFSTAVTLRRVGASHPNAVQDTDANSVVNQGRHGRSPVKPSCSRDAKRQLTIRSHFSGDSEGPDGDYGAEFAPRKTVIATFWDG